MKVSLTITFDSLEEYQSFEFRQKLKPKRPIEVEDTEPETPDISEKDSKLEFPTIEIPKSKRKDDYVPVPNLSGGIGTPLFDLGQVISTHNGTKQYSIIAEFIMDHLRRKEFMDGFSIRAIRHAVKEWYKKYRKISDTTVNLYATYYLDYFINKARTPWTYR